jgi:ferredoxin
MRIAVQSEECTGCGECEETCSQHHYGVNDREKSAVRVKEDANNPGDYIIAMCDQCGECAKLCSTDTIALVSGDRYILDSNDCMYCTNCIDSCPMKVIFEHKDLDAPFKCDLCMECVDACPSGALSAEE